MYRTRAGIDHADGSYTEFEVDYTYSEGNPGNYFTPMEPESVEIQKIRITKSVDADGIFSLSNLGPLSLTLDTILEEEEIMKVYQQLLFAVQSSQAEEIK